MAWHGAQCQATGGIFGALDLQNLGPIVQMIPDGKVATSELRELLKDHLTAYLVGMKSQRTMYVAFEFDVSSMWSKGAYPRQCHVRTTLVDLACSETATPEMSAAIYAGILQLHEVARGNQTIENPDMIVETARQASQSRNLLE
jgi:hypothetical protein